jgi:flavin-dependent dehydrogenase
LFKEGVKKSFIMVKSHSKTAYDVVVIGCGPAGCSAAKRCVENDLKTVIVERKKVPREKVCSGMLMGDMAKELTNTEFGAIPNDVVLHRLRGIKIIVPRIGDITIENEMPLFWRRDFDGWLLAEATRKGAKLNDQLSVKGIVEEKDIYLVEHGTGKIACRFVIAADGSSSSIRRQLFPGIEAKYSVTMRECYIMDLGIDRDYYNWVFYKGRLLPRFSLHYKKDNLIFQMSAGRGIKFKDIISDVKEYMVENYSFDRQHRPIWRDGTTVVESIASAETLGRGRILFVGDAAGLGMPPSMEGIGTAMESGILAAEAVVESIKTGRDSLDIYRRRVKPLLNEQKRLHNLWEEAKNRCGDDMRLFVRELSNVLKISLGVKIGA